jgi:predicted dehydrogenase
MAKKLKVGIIGTGFIARGAHIPGYNSMPDEVEIKWLCDIKPEALAESLKMAPDAKTTADYHDLLNDPEVDAVSICTPNLMHLQPALDALAAGKHVLCEKPLAMNGHEARQIVAAEQKSDKVFQVGFQTRFTGEAQFLRKYIDSGAMGDIYYARTQALRRRGVPGWGVFIDKEKQGGGPLIDIGVHVLDLTLFLMGHPEPVSASGVTWNMLGKNPDLYNGWGDYDRTKFTVEDMAVGFIRFANGAVCVLESSFMANIKDDPFGTTILGTEAGAEVFFYNDQRVRIYRDDNKQLFDLTPRSVPEVKNSHVAEVQAFIKTIKEGAPSLVTARQAMMLNSIFDALYKSAETGKEEAIQLI